MKATIEIDLPEDGFSWLDFLSGAFKEMVLSMACGYGHPKAYEGTHRGRTWRLTVSGASICRHLAIAELCEDCIRAKVRNA